MTNRVLPYLLVLLLLTWIADRQNPASAGPRGPKDLQSVYQLQPITSIQVPGKTVHNGQHCLRRVRVSPTPSNPPVISSGDMGTCLANSGFSDNNLNNPEDAGLIQGHFRHLFPSHYFW
ncbi:MAG: hypothetical protein NVV59_19115 [Chitinophagaceae bacterium]|nr:hypothetical protein [Chitinophagaceae bacterium]